MPLLDLVILLIVVGVALWLVNRYTPPPAQVEVAEKTLPKTASPLPLIGLFGLLSLGGAFTLRAIASRIR